MKIKSPLVKHLVIAYKNWIEASSGVPRIYVDVTKHHMISVPMELVEDDNTIVLYISTAATRNMSFEDDALRFTAMFNSVPTSLVIPYECIVSVYDKDSGSGTIFNPLDTGAYLPVSPPVDLFMSSPNGNTKEKIEVMPVMLVLPKPSRDRSHLKLVVDNTKPKVEVKITPQ